MCFLFSAPASTCSRFYTVVAGDTCDAICAKENVSSYVPSSHSVRSYTSLNSLPRSFQLATVNANVINAQCTNLDIGEVRHPL